MDMAVELTKLLQLVIDKKASELQLTSGLPPTIILRGNRRPLNLPPLTPNEVVSLLRGGAPAPVIQEFKEKGRCEFGWPFRDAHFFVTGSTTNRQRSVRFCLVPKKRPDPPEHE